MAVFNAGVAVKGLKSLNKALKALPPRIAKKVIRSATVNAAGIVRKAAKAKARFRTGLLRAKIAVRTRETTNTYVTVAVGLPKKGGRQKAFYGLFYELGTSRRAAEPFIRPAFDENKNAVIKRLKERIWIGIRKQTQKLRKK